MIKRRILKQIIDLIKAEWAKRNDQDVVAHLLSGAPSQGMMSTMDYRVGDTQGVKTGCRTQIIKEVLTSPLPFVESPAYMREWGEPCSKERYNKIKNSLFGQEITLCKGKNYRAIYQSGKKILTGYERKKIVSLLECNKEKK